MENKKRALGKGLEQLFNSEPLNIDTLNNYEKEIVNNTKESIKRSEFEGKTPEEIVSIVKKIITVFKVVGIRSIVSHKFWSFSHILLILI